MKDRERELRHLSSQFPRAKSMLLMNVLGDVNLTLPTEQDRVRYKEQYEKFKLKITYIIIAISLRAFQHLSETKP
jgi:hypothetical protein